jgi:hypothetical protein
MSTGEQEARTVRVDAWDLAIGDDLIDRHGAYMGTVDTVPDRDRMPGYVQAWVKARNGVSKERRWRNDTVLWIRIARRTS